MTFEEIKEMINSTIVENGERQITGKALNLALLEIITAMEENKPEGGGAETVYLGEPLSPEYQAINAATFAKCKANTAEGKALPAIVVDATELAAESYFGTKEGVRLTVPCFQTIFVDQSSPAASASGQYGLMVETDNGPALVNEDGSIMLMQ